MHLSVPAERIEQVIYVVCGHRVMLDSDLAELYGVEVKQLKRQVRRNGDRFPPDLLLELSEEEHRALRRQFGTLKRGKHAKYKPYPRRHSSGHSTPPLYSGRRHMSHWNPADSLFLTG